MERSQRPSVRGGEVGGSRWLAVASPSLSLYVWWLGEVGRDLKRLGGRREKDGQQGKTRTYRHSPRRAPGR